MEVEKIFGERIRKLRTQNKLTQKQLGEVVGLTHKSISTIESGICATTLEKLVALAKFFNVSTDYLLGVKDEP